MWLSLESAPALSSELAGTRRGDVSRAAAAPGGYRELVREARVPPPTAAGHRAAPGYRPDKRRSRPERNNSDRRRPTVTQCMQREGTETGGQGEREREREREDTQEVALDDGMEL